MEPELRKHSCKLGVDYEKKLILCAPEEGADYVVLTTPILYAWHVQALATEEGIRHGKIIDVAGYVGKDLVVKLSNDYKILFLRSKEIFVYGLILSEDRNVAIFSSDKDSAKTIQGSIYLYRKTVFISHASSDKAMVRDLATRLERTINVWLDEKSILVGDSITEKIDEGLQGCDALVLWGLS